jgi:hypothetical protein
MLRVVSRHLVGGGSPTANGGRSRNICVSSLQLIPIQEQDQLQLLQQRLSFHAPAYVAAWPRIKLQLA